MGKIAKVATIVALSIFTLLVQKDTIEGKNATGFGRSRVSDIESVENDDSVENGGGRHLSHHGNSFQMLHNIWEI